MDKVDFNAPKGWSWKSFKDVCVLKRGYDLPKHARSVGDFPLYSANGVTDYIDQYKVDGPGVVTGRSGTIGKVHFVEGDYWPLNTALYVQKFNGNSPHFIKYFLESFDLTRFASGAAVPTLNRNSLSAELVCVPDSVEEQKRIVEKLDALFSRIDTATDHLQESITLADELAQNGIDAYFAELSNSVVPLSELVNFISGYAFKSGDFLSESGIKPIKITNVGVNEFSENKEEFLPASYRKEFERFSVKNNDIAIALTRPIINGGLKVCRVPETYSGALVNQRVAAITSDNERLLDFIYLYLQSSRTRNYVREKSKSLNQPNLSITDLKNLSMPFPEGNKDIENAVIDCNALILKARTTKSEIIKKISLLSKLKASILDSAFKGEL